MNLRFKLKWIFHRGLQAALFWVIASFIYSLHWDKISSVLPQIGAAILTTIQLTVLSLAFGFILAWPLALLRTKRNPEWLAKFADGFVALFRGTPLLVQIYVIYYGLAGEEWFRGSIFWFLFKDAYFCVVFGFSLNAAAYACEIFRGALVNGANSERESAMSLGLSNWQVDWLVWIPASWRRALPQYGNEMIFMLHGTAIAGLVTLSDVFGVSRDINRKFYLTYEGLITAAIIYVLLTLLIVQLNKLLEKRFLGHQSR